LALAGCGGSGGSGGTPTSPAASGTPVRLMVIAPTGTAGANYPELVAAARAAVRGVNGRGGISGHRVELLYCNERNDATTAKRCAQQAVDQHVLAVVAEVSGSGGIMPILAKANIPSIGSGGISADASELNSKISFMISPLTFYPSACPSLLKKAGATRLGLVGYDLNASDRLITLAEVGGKAVGLPLAPKLRVPLTTSDFIPTVSQLDRSGADGTVLVVFDQAAYAVMSHGSATMRYCHASGALSEQWLAGRGKAADNLVVATAFPEFSQAADFPELRRAIAELDGEQRAGDADAAPGLRKTTTSIGAWLSVQIAEKVGNQVSGELTAASLLRQLNATRNLDLKLIPPLDFTRPNPIPGVPRLFNTTMRGARWDATTKSFVSLGPETYPVLTILQRGAR
jgi:hypothetical protein